jgi:hypothetical protein
MLGSGPAGRQGGHLFPNGIMECWNSGALEYWSSRVLKEWMLEERNNGITVKSFQKILLGLGALAHFSHFL